MRIVAIRPEPGLSATIVAGRAAGLEIEGWPLFEIRPCDWAPPSPDSIDAVLLGSANALRHGGQVVELFNGKPVFAVGYTTAEAAREAGFAVAATGEGGLQPLLDGLTGERLRLLRLAGAERVPLAPPAGIELVTRTVYESAALPMPAELEAALRAGALVLAHSAVAVRHLADQCDARGVARAGIAIAALSPRIAAEAGSGWARVAAAENPREAALLALARDMCH
jgi:uroporphyrinogen-III synthase